MFTFPDENVLPILPLAHEYQLEQCLCKCEQLLIKQNWRSSQLYTPHLAVLAEQYQLKDLADAMLRKVQAKESLYAKLEAQVASLRLEANKEENVKREMELKRSEVAAVLWRITDIVRGDYFQVDQTVHMKERETIRGFKLSRDLCPGKPSRHLKIGRHYPGVERNCLECCKLRYEMITKIVNKCPM